MRNGIVVLVLAVVMMGHMSPVGAASNKVSGTLSGGYGLHASKGRILVEVRPDPQTLVYRGQELRFLGDDGKKVCLPLYGGQPVCPQKFLGALRFVTVKFIAKGGELPAGLVLRERVTLTGKSNGLPGLRDVFERTLPVVGGIAQDIQSWGYDESALPKTEVKDSRRAFLSTWLEYRQELFIGDETSPFAVLVWRHTASSIDVVSVSQVPDATTTATLAVR
jgi:hypothetical protein